ncbi:MAG: hypothetical protein ACLTR4_09350 [Gallintestinimicrobium sp.]
MKLLESWTFSEPLPEPVKTLAEEEGRKTTTYLERCSAYNDMEADKKSNAAWTNLARDWKVLRGVGAGKRRSWTGVRHRREDIVLLYGIRPSCRAVRIFI